LLFFEKPKKAFLAKIKPFLWDYFWTPKKAYEKSLLAEKKA